MFFNDSKYIGTNYAHDISNCTESVQLNMEGEKKVQDRMLHLISDNKMTEFDSEYNRKTYD